MINPITISWELFLDNEGFSPSSSDSFLILPLPKIYNPTSNKAIDILINKVFYEMSYLYLLGAETNESFYNIIIDDLCSEIETILHNTNYTMSYDNIIGELSNTLDRFINTLEQKEPTGLYIAGWINVQDKLLLVLSD